MADKALQPVEQKSVLFYGDQITAVRLEDGRVFVPIRPLTRLLGINWDAQRRRIDRDLVLSDESRRVVVTTTRRGLQEMTCLPLDYIAGFLFGINASRVKPEIQERLVRYQRDCYKVLAEAFQDGRLTTDTDPEIEALLQQDSPAAQAYQIAMAVVRMARQQLIIEAQLQDHTTQLDDHTERLELLETAIGGKHVTEAQASQISQAVKAIGLTLGKQTKRNEFGAIYGELYRKFSVTSYKAIPQSKFDAVMKFLNEWLQSLIGDEPF